MNPIVNRREFMTVVAGTGATLASSCGSGNPVREDPAVHRRGFHAVIPKRAFGNTGVQVSALCFGGASVLGTDSRALLDEALRHGMDCWEFTAFTGNAFGDYFSKHPGVREKVFLSAKVKSTDPAVMQEQLNDTLRANATSVIDFLAVHVLDTLGALTDDVRRWVEKVKKEGKVRFFGFCTHKNMDHCLKGAAGLGWIDGIQTSYNYRIQSIGSMEDALKSCHEKGIGIFVVKSMGLGVQHRSGQQKLPLDEEKLTSLLAGHGLSFEQAKLKAVWQNPHVTSICSLMPSLAILRSNAAAAADERPLGAEVVKLLADYSKSSGRYFCRRCGTCDTATADRIPIFDIMEMLMYLRAYGNKALAVKAFSMIPAGIRDKIRSSDYSVAEERCPQKMPIATLMKEACAELSG